VKNLQAWSRITNQLYIWHYNTNFSHYLLPFPDFDQVAATVPMYKRSGVVGIFFEGAYPPGGGGEAAELRSWVLARQLWDASTNVDHAVGEFLYAVYGKAARAMRRWYDLQQKEVREGRHIWIFNVPDFSPKFLARATDIFEQAEWSAQNDVYLARVRKARLSLEYYDLLNARRCEFRGNSYGPADPDAVRHRWAALATALRGFGIKSIHEGRNLEVDDRDYAAIRSYETLSLEDGRWRVDVAPGLGGRVIRLLNKSTGRDLVRRTGPGEGGYPNVGGGTVSVHADYQARAWPVSWTGERTAAGTIQLVGATENGLKLTRVLNLTSGGLSDSITAENAGGATVGAVLRASIDLDPGDIDRAAVRFRRADGGETVRVLMRPEEQSVGSEMWSGTALPAGEWRLENAGVVSRFHAAAVERAALGWTARTPPRVTFTTWSKPGEVRADKPLRLTVEYGVY
jgi:hypothetical protein